MIKIPLQPIPSQGLRIALDGQRCEIHVYYRFGSTYLDLICEGEAVQTGAICRDRDGIITIAQSVFSGQLLFVDMLGTSDPFYKGFGERWRLFFRAADEL